MVFFSSEINKEHDTRYKRNAENTALTVAGTIDVAKVAHVKNEIKSVLDTVETPVLSDDWGSPEWEAYIALFEPAINNCIDDYNDLFNSLSYVMDNNTNDIDCVYLSFIDVRTETFIYIVDSAGEDGCPPGCADVIYDQNKELLTNPSRGFPSYITNTPEYGWLVTAGSPIYQGDEVIAYAMVDITMGTIKAAQQKSILTLGLYILLSVVAIVVVSFFFFHFGLIRPIKKLTRAAKQFNSNGDDQNSAVFTNLKINTRDEIQDLTESMRDMEVDINSKIKSLTLINAELSESKQEITHMAAIVNKDGLTGVRNKIAYDTVARKLDTQIEDGEKVEFAVTMIDLNDLKIINDQKGHNAGDVALMKLSSLICGVFSHSPVFRVGGDEFVVVSKNVDYKKIDVLTKEFNYKIDQLSKDEYLHSYERISAAIGYAKYNPKTDKCVQDVFNRADEAMYARKREMKSKR